jgi:hypothetical protein
MLVASEVHVVGHDEARAMQSVCLNWTIGTARASSLILRAVARLRSLCRGGRMVWMVDEVNAWPLLGLRAAGVPAASLGGSCGVG